MADKYLYCPKCKAFPDRIEEQYLNYYELRKWNGEEYETVDTGQEMDSRYVCGECGTELEDR